MNVLISLLQNWWQWMR